jgi:hypothetical protein
MTSSSAAIAAYAGLTDAEVRAFKLLRDNIVLAGHSSRKPVGALAKAISDFASDPDALGAALIALVFHLVRRENSRECIMSMLNDLRAVTVESVPHWTEHPHEFARCVHETADLPVTKRVARVSRVLRDGYANAQSIEKAHLQHAETEGTYHVVDTERFWNAVNADYDRKEPSDRLVARLGIVRTRHGTLCLGCDFAPENRCVICQAVVSAKSDYLQCACRASRACRKCVNAGKRHDCEPVLEKCKAAAAQLTGNLIPVVLTPQIVVPVLTQHALHWQNLGVLWPAQMTDTMIETCIRHPEGVDVVRRNRAELERSIACAAVELVADDRVGETENVSPAGVTGRARTKRAKRERRAERRQATEEARAAEAEAELARRKAALDAIDAAARRRRRRHAANLACLDLANALLTVNSLDGAIEARRSFATARGRAAGADTESRARLRDAEARFNAKWLPELRISIEYRLLQDAVRQDVALEHSLERRRVRQSTAPAMTPEKWAGRLAHRVALSVLE